MSDLLKNWEQGVRDFNAGKYWHAHESWERGWRELHEPEKTYVQALIQVAGVFDLVRRGRTDAARRLARSALEKLERASDRDRFPRVEIEGGRELLIRVTACSEAEIQAELEAFSPEARLLLSPPKRVDVKGSG